MRILSRLRFGHKMVVMPIVAGAAFCLVLAASLVLGSKSQHALEFIESGHYPAVELNRDLENLLAGIQRQLQDAVGTENVVELAVADLLRDEFLEQLAKGRDNPMIDRGHLDQLEHQFIAYYELAKRTSEGMIGRDFAEEFTPALQAMSDGHNEISSVLEADTIGAQQDIRTAFARARGAQRDLTVSIAAILVICLVALGLTARAVAAAVTSPVTDAIRIAGTLSRGDLSAGVEDIAKSVHCEQESQDEVTALLVTLGQMAQGLLDLVRGVHAHTEAVSEVTAILHGASSEMSSSVSRQEQAVGAASSSVEHVGLAVSEVASNVDSLSSAAVRASTSVTELDDSFNETVALVDRHSESVDGAASAVGDLTTSMSQIAKSAELLSTSTDSTASSLQALGKAVVDVEQTAQQTHELTQAVREQAERGMEKVDETCESMDDIFASYRGLEKIVSSLSEKSNSIGEINRVIEGVLEQTHLLALNATIISAQAGEHGRAFAVVAQQVSSLADRTTSSTQEIRALIEDVQEEVDGAVEAIAGGSKRVDLGVALSKEAGSLLSGIRESTQECMSNADEIVMSTSQQARDIGQVSKTMVRLRDVAEQLDNATREQERASTQIRGAMDELGGLAHQIKTASHEQSQSSQVITTVVEEVASRIQQIADAAEEQGRSGSEIRQAIEVFGQAVSESTQRASVVAETVASLRQKSEDLESEVERFII